MKNGMAHLFKCILFFLRFQRVFYFKMIVQWNQADFLNPLFFEPPDNMNQKWFPFSQSNTESLLPISRSIQLFKPSFISLELEARNIGLNTYFSSLIVHVM